MQGTWIWSLIQEDPTCPGATKLCTTTVEPTAWEPHPLSPSAPATDAHALQSLRSTTREATCIEKPAQGDQRIVPAYTTRETPTQQQRPNTAQNKSKQVNKIIKKESESFLKA